VDANTGGLAKLREVIWDMKGRISVVVITRNRAPELLRTVQILLGLPENPPVLVLDNGSTDSTASCLRDLAVTVVSLGKNMGAAARNVGVWMSRTDYVAFSDDDSWWAPGSLSNAVRIFDVSPRLAVATARVVVEPTQREDPTCTAMANSPLPAQPGIPGVPVLGFLAGACVVRRSAFLSIGGFEPRYFIGGEEELMAIDLVACGWLLAYLPELQAHHAPSLLRDDNRRQSLVLRNALWSAWLRRPVGSAAARTYQLIARASPARSKVAACLSALGGLGWVARNRQVVHPDVLRLLHMIDRH
jgi:N-acetylglucosaminyl-diphospho-decaprenol L-rhamnosyltransferase